MIAAIEDPPMERKVRVAIVGFSFMGTTHAQAYQALADADLVAVVARDKVRAADNLGRLNLKNPVYSSLSELLASEDVDAIDICTPTDLHADFALEAIAAGKHVFCEKPLALDPQDAERICVAVEERGVFAQVGHCIRFWPEYQALTKLVRSGSAGRILSLSLERRGARPSLGVANWLNDPTRSGGAAMDLHIHDTDLVLDLFGRPQAVTSTGTQDAFGWSQIHTIYHYADVAVAADGGWNSPENWGFKMAFQAVFERAVLEYDCRRTPTLCITNEKGNAMPHPFETPFRAESVSGLGNLSSLGGYYNELAYFINCIANNCRPEIATPAQARDAVKLVWSEIASAAERRTISLKGF